MQERIQVVYRVQCPADEIGQYAKAMALEQTVEVPESLVTEAYIRESIVGQVERIEPVEGEGESYLVHMGYNPALASNQIPQLLNLLFGNISIKGNIRIDDVVLPEGLLAQFEGPRFGIEGVRGLLGVHGRPLLATALKPKGLSGDALAALAGAFALGGGDLVKDDHNLAEATFEAFKDRVSRCQAAVEKANESTGRNCLYLPNLLGPVEELERQLDFLMGLGVQGVLVCPLLVGLDQLRYYAAHYPLVFMSHPAMTGSFYVDGHQGMAPEFMLGKLFRWLGCDISVFPNYGGRFGLTREQCQGIQRALAQPEGAMAPALPAPAGGMQFDRLADMADAYGEEAVFLIGGGLLSHSDNLSDGVRAFLDGIRGHFTERLSEPRRTLPSSCEMPAPAQAPLLEKLTHLAFGEGFTWRGRPAAEYKAPGGLPFEGVARTELIGKAGEKAAFDLRYFELAPGGYTSHEKHMHTHTIIAVRGEGMLRTGEEEHPLKPFDIAYVDSLMPHQLRNNGQEPFGFFCIVDRDRDRPMAP